MSTQQDIYAVGYETYPPMLNKENYVPWSSRLLRYAKSRANGKLIYNSIINGLYVRRMIPELGDPDREVPVNETFPEQTDDELTEKELKQVKADDQAIQTILLGLPEEIYDAVDSCETAKEIWLRVQQMMKGFDIRAQEKKAKLFNEWKRKNSQQSQVPYNIQPEWKQHITIVRQTKDLHEVDYTQLYDFLKMNHDEVNELRAERLAKTHDPLALMTHSQNPYNYLVFYQDQPSTSNYMQQPIPNNNNFNPQPSFNTNYMQQPMPNPEDIIDPTTAMNMALVLMAKALKLNYSTPTNNNQRISSNPSNRQIAQPGINIGQDRQMQMVRGNGGNQLRQYAGQNIGNLNGIANPNANLNGNSNVVAAWAEGDLDEIKEFNANCILMANLQQTSTSVEQHPATVKETRALYDSLYNNLSRSFILFYVARSWDAQSIWTGNLKASHKFRASAEKFLGTVRFGNDHVAAILGFDDLQ
ncbi:hypothetical protein Tco_0940084 [Tanacetum coccineum]|uniref:Gag protein n=1 Tax=Tanacetum coccineum TaxID=301880 RepID=A0ABQ5DML0_9ASTR